MWAYAQIHHTIHLIEFNQWNDSVNWNSDFLAFQLTLGGGPYNNRNYTIGLQSKSMGWFLYDRRPSRKS